MTRALATYHQLSGEGTYASAIYGTPGGAGVISSTQQTFSTTSALLEMENSAPAGSQIISQPHYARFLITAADAGGTTLTGLDFCGVLDPILRYSSGGYQPIAPEWGFCNTRFTTVAPITNIHVGNLTLTAPSANRFICKRGRMKQAATAPIFVVGDELVWTFGPVEDEPITPKLGTTAALYRRNMGPVTIEPQGSFALLTWAAGITTGFTFEFEIGWWERVRD